VRKAITAGEIDIYPEYTGNAGFFFNKADDAAWKNIDQGYELARKLDYDANKIVWLTPSPANNTWALAVRSDVAGPNKLKSLTDFGKWVAGGGAAKLAASAEFVNSAGALPAFQTTYGFQLKPDQMVVLSGGDTAATIKAAADQTNGVNTAMVYGTDGAIEAAELTVLEDDKNVQQVYAPTPIIREEVLKANPKIEEVLSPIFKSLTADELRKLNAKIQVDGEPAKSVAEAYLKEKGFLK
jgi:osmoprotectant transport system substrate-binding protein